MYQFSDNSETDSIGPDTIKRFFAKQVNTVLTAELICGRRFGEELDNDSVLSYWGSRALLLAQTLTPKWRKTDLAIHCPQKEKKVI